MLGGELKNLRNEDAHVSIFILEPGRISGILGQVLLKFRSVAPGTCCFAPSVHVISLLS